MITNKIKILRSSCMIYITGDIHREQDIHKINPREFEAGNHLTPDDYVIICGDFGCIWDGGSGDEFWLKWLASLPWNTLFVDGNHENFDVLSTYPIVDYKGGKARKIRDNVYHLMRGEVYEIDGRSFFTFGGAYSHDLMYRTEHVNWWKNELPTKAEAQNALNNLEKHDWNVDYVISHDVYTSHPLSKKYDMPLSPYGPDYVDIHSLLEQFNKKLQYKVWFCGHYHGDYIHYDQKKPCITLFNHVVLLEELEKYLPLLKRIE